MKYPLKNFLFISLSILFFNDFKSQSKVHYINNLTIRGTVYEKETGEPSFGTNVKIKGTGTGSSTDLNGFFQINRLSPGKIVLEISNIEFKTIVEEIELKSNKKILTKNFFMEPNDEVLDEFEYSAEAEERKTEVKMSVITATPKDMARVVAIGGEPDFAQYLQTTPGVVTTGDQGGQMYIRGGSPIQNKVLLDGMTIYNPFHSIGFFSCPPPLGTRKLTNPRSPLSIYSKVEQTYVDGRLLFDSEKQEDLFKENEAKRSNLITEMIAAKKDGVPTQRIKKQVNKLHKCNDFEIDE